MGVPDPVTETTGLAVPEEGWAWRRSMGGNAAPRARGEEEGPVVAFLASRMALPVTPSDDSEASGWVGGWVGG